MKLLFPFLIRMRQRSARQSGRSDVCLNPLLDYGILHYFPSERETGSRFQFRQKIKFVFILACCTLYLVSKITVWKCFNEKGWINISASLGNDFLITQTGNLQSVPFSAVNPREFCGKLPQKVTRIKRNYVWLWYANLRQKLRLTTPTEIGTAMKATFTLYKKSISHNVCNRAIYKQTWLPYCRYYHRSREGWALW